MSKREFLDLLRYYLRSYPNNIISDMVADYEEHFRIGIEKGKTEEEIAKELGSPKDIAEEFYVHEVPPRQNEFKSDGKKKERQGRDPHTEDKEGKKEKSSLSPWTIVLIVIACITVGPPALGVALGLLGAILGILIAMVATVIALGIAGLMSMVGWAIPSLNGIGFCALSLHPVTSILLGIALTALSIVIAYLIVIVIKLCIQGLKKLYLSIKWNLAKRRGNQ